jgi:hypothetical protein
LKAYRLTQISFPDDQSFLFEECNAILEILSLVYAATSEIYSFLSTALSSGVSVEAPSFSKSVAGLGWGVCAFKSDYISPSQLLI